MIPKRNLIEKITVKDALPQKLQKQFTSLHQNISQKNVLQSLTHHQQKAVRKQFEENANKQQSFQEYQNLTQESKEKKQNLQQSIIHDLKNNLSQISASVSTIKSQYTSLRQSESQLLLNTRTNKSKQKKLSKLDHPEIVSFLFKKQQQKEQRQKRRLDQIAKIQKKRKQQEQNKLKQKEQQKAEKINQIKKKWFVKDKNMSKKQEQALKQKQIDQIYQKYRNSIPLFQIKQKQDKEEQIRRAEYVKQYLKKYKQTYMEMNQSWQQKRLTQHQKKHQQMLQKLRKQKNQQKIEILQKIQQDNESLKNLYRGKFSEKVVQQMKIQEQKRQIPYRIRQRIKGYENFVKQNYKPKESKSQVKKMRSNSSSIETKGKRNNDSNLSFREIKRYKYLHGVSYGEVIEQRPLAKSFDEEKRVGNGYLEFMKSLPKKRTQKSSSMVIPIKLSPKPNPLHHNRPKNAFININDEPTRDEIKMVLQQLRLNDKKIENRQKMVSMKGANNQQSQESRRQINNELLMNVQKKMNLLHKLQSNKVPLK